MAATELRVLVVDDRGALSALVGSLQARGCEVLTATDTAAAVERLGEHPVVMVVLPIEPAGDGAADVIRRVQAAQPSLSCAAILAPDTVAAAAAALTAQSNGHKHAPAAGEPTALRDVERRHIALVLQQSGGNVSRAARLLQIDRVTLYNKIRKYSLRGQAKTEPPPPGAAEPPPATKAS
jgi:DNA-binding NtrC family response regulator